VAGRALLRRTRVDAVISSSAPITAHLIARRLCGHRAIPWVADFRDPWSAFLPSGSPLQRRASRLERSLAHAASRVVMPSPSWATLHERQWGRTVDVITNGYTVAGDNGRAPASDFVIGYLGTLYPDRQDLSTIWRAIPALGNGTRVDRIRFIGREPPGVRAQLREHGLEDRLDVTGYLSYDEAISYMNRSTVLVLAGPTDASTIRRGEIPGKLFEYLASGLPVIYVGDPAADAAELLRGRPGCSVIAPGDVGGAVAALRAAHGARHERDVREFSRSALTGRLVQLLHEACGEARGGLPARPA
jgi:glycosyltransferase involved in cell wall biosynthesis